MKIVDKIVTKLGHDKVLHFTVGALIAYFINNLGIVQNNWNIAWRLIFPIVGLIIVFGLSVLKEKVFDDTIDKKDILFGCIGAAIPFISNTIGLLI